MSRVSRFINNLKKKPVNAIIDCNIYPDRKDSYAGNSIADKSIKVIDFSYGSNIGSVSEQICHYFNDKALSASACSYKDEISNQSAIFLEKILINLIYADKNFQMADLYSKVQDEVRYLESNGKESQIVFLTICSDDYNQNEILHTVRNFTKGLSSVLFRHTIMVRGMTSNEHLPFEKLGGCLEFLISKYGDVFNGETIDLRT